MDGNPDRLRRAVRAVPVAKAPGTVCVVGSVRRLVWSVGPALRNAELIHHLLGDLLKRAELGIHEHVGLTIELFAFGQQLADPGERINVFKQRPMALSAFPVAL